ncbi:MAG: fluoride efflux transporter CrcB [Myxococcales bacterium]|nr:fluoride efflux transporter CrcB [Myxococcales bacterium]
MNVLLVGLGGAVGSIGRYLVGLATQKIAGEGTFPWGTLVANILGSLVLGVIMFGALEARTISPRMRLALATGLMGGFTTYSSFAFETVHMMRDGAAFTAIGYALGTTVICLAGSALGYWIGGLVFQTTLGS